MNRPFFYIKSIFLTLLFLGTTNARAQLTFHIDTVFFRNQEVHKVSVGPDKNVWCIKGGTKREVGEVLADLTVRDITASVTSLTASTFVSVIGLDSNRAFIGTQNDYIVRINTDGSAMRIGPAQGLNNRSINAMLRNESSWGDSSIGIPYFHQNAILIGTDTGLYTTDNRLSFRKAIDMESKFVPEVTSKAWDDYLCISEYPYHYDPEDNGWLYTKFQRWGLIYDSTRVKSYEQPVVNSVAILADNFRLDNRIWWYWATSNGLFKRNRVNAFSGPDIYKFHFLQNQAVYKLRIVPENYSYNNYLLAASDSGLYAGKAYFELFTESTGPDTLLKVNLGVDLKAYDLAVDSGGCGVLWLATDKGLYKLSTNYDKENIFNAITPQGAINICDRLVTITSTLSRAVQWQKDGTDLAGEMNPTYASSIPGTYRFRVVNDLTNSCYSKPVALKKDTTLSFTYHPPRAEICPGDSTGFNVSPAGDYTYVWYKDGQVIPGADSVKYASQPGYYKVKVTNCYHISAVSDSALAYPAALPPAIIYPVNSIICDGQPMYLRTTATGFHIKWLFYGLADGSDSVYAAQYTGNYQLVLQDSAGCSVTSDPLNVLQTVKPRIDLIPQDSAGICRGDSLLLKGTATSPVYYWVNSGNSTDLSVTLPGTYLFEAYYDSGCVARDSVVVRVWSLPVVHLGKDTSLCEGELLPVHFEITSGYPKYVWNIASGNVNYADMYKAGTVTVSATDSRNCTASDTGVVTEKCRDMVIPNVFTPNGDGVNEAFEIKNLLPNSTLSVYNRWGTVIYSSDGYDNSWKADGAPEGLYYYNLFNTYYKNNLKGWVEVVR